MRNIFFTMRFTEENLPRILCLHGGGSSAAIFRVQTLKLQNALRKHFRFFFVNAPFASSPGPGMLPVFEGAGPYRRWHCDESGISIQEITERWRAHEKQVVSDYLDNALGEADDHGAPIVGLLGFSQGTRVVTGHLLDRRRQQSLHHERSSLRFAVLICGNYPPLPFTDIPNPVEKGSKSNPPLAPATPTATVSPASSSSSNWGKISADKTGLLDDGFPNMASSTDGTTSNIESDHLNIPSVHVHGLQDPWLREGRDLLAKCYDEEHASLIEFQGGHHLPSAQREIDELAKAIINAYNTAKDLR
jgi:pimeloyl-ACP methyl ester carboxylesterase